MSSDSDKNMLVLPDNGGRRSGLNRRQIVYTDYIPCRRITPDRRSGRDRRSGMDRRKTSVDLEKLDIPERRSGKDRRKAFQTTVF